MKEIRKGGKTKKKRKKEGKKEKEIKMRSSIGRRKER